MSAQPEDKPDHAPLPCPFCGGTKISTQDGSTFRWLYAGCNECGAQAGEVRVQTMGDGNPVMWQQEAIKDAFAEWNRRATVPECGTRTNATESGDLPPAEGPTPRTDLEQFDPLSLNGHQPLVVWAKFARQLERELDACASREAAAVKEAMRLGRESAEALRLLSDADQAIRELVTPVSATPESAYDIAADAVQDVADAATRAFREAGMDPGEWDNDNIVEDVKRGIAADIARLAARSTAPLFVPNETMLNAARDWSHEKFGKPIGNDAATGCWQAMYTALYRATPVSATQERK